MSELVTYWLSFESQTTREWLGTLIVDSEDMPLDDESGEAFIARLVEQGLCPPSGDRWNVRVQKLPAGTEIPRQHKNRLIIDSSVTAGDHALPLGASARGEARYAEARKERRFRRLLQRHVAAD